MLRLGLISGLLISSALVPSFALAADMPEYIEPAPLPEPEAYGGWYLRGDIGASHQKVDDFGSPYFTEGANDFDLQYADFDASWFVGLGFGYKFNDWVRVDLTGEFRGKSDFTGLDHYNDINGDFEASNEYSGHKSEWVVLANGYIDMPGFGNVTPFIGAGVGAANIKIGDFVDYNPVNDAMGVSGDTDSWNFAWALYAGLAFAVTPNMTIELAYRYLDMGDADTENLLTPDGVDIEDNPYYFNDIISHDVKLGMRYMFN